MKWKITLVLFLAMVLIATVPAQANVFYTTNYNPTFVDSQHWYVDTWGPTGKSWHTQSIAGGVSSTRAAIWGNWIQWGNTEYEQGTDPWATYGNLMYNPPLTTPQQLIVTARVTEKHVDWLFGQVNAYVEFWVCFDEPVGTHGYVWAELQIFLCSKAGWFNPCLARRNGYATRTVENSWYHVMYRVNNLGSSWSTRTISLQGLLDRLQSTWNIDISKGQVTCICFGVEGVRGEMTVQYDTVNFQVAM